jgi:hypothetical protein
MPQLLLRATRARDHGPSVSISVSFAGVQRRPGLFTQFRRAWSRLAPAAPERSSTELESVLGKPDIRGLVGLEVCDARGHAVRCPAVSAQ